MAYPLAPARSVLPVGSVAPSSWVGSNPYATNPSFLSPLPRLPLPSQAMAAATPGGVHGTGGYGDLPGLGPDDHLGLDDVDGSSSYYSSADDEDLEEEAALSMEDRVKLAEIWVAHPTSSHQWTSGAAGGVL